MSNQWDWKVRGYAGAYHQRGVPFGVMLVETVHKGDSSKDMEVNVWRKRAERGEVSKVEIIDLHKFTMETMEFPTPKRRPKPEHRS